jgi:hypothetical protein
MMLPLCAILAAGVLAAAGPVAPEDVPRDLARAEYEARWAVVLTLPEGSDQDVRFHEIRTYPHANPGGVAGILVCGMLDFADAEANRVRFVVLFEENGQGALTRAEPPFFHGLDWLRGSVMLADLCEAAEERTLSREDAALVGAEHP